MLEDLKMGARNSNFSNVSTQEIDISMRRMSASLPRSQKDFSAKQRLSLSPRMFWISLLLLDVFRLAFVNVFSLMLSKHFHGRIRITV